MSFMGQLQNELAEFKKEGVYKRLNCLDSPQGPRVKMEGRGDVVILSSNNYLGLCAVPEVVQAGKDALERWGAGTGSVRFICGTFTVHRELENALARFVGCESSLSYVSCWNANEGLCPTVLSEPDVVISDQLNHASIIDSIRRSEEHTSELQSQSKLVCRLLLEKIIVMASGRQILMGPWLAPGSEARRAGM